MPKRLLEENVKALAFDVFGTVVDWRGSIIREAAAFGAEHGIDADWTRFADCLARRLSAGHAPRADGSIAVAEDRRLAPAHSRRPDGGVQHTRACRR